MADSTVRYIHHLRIHRAADLPGKKEEAFRRLTDGV